MKHRFSILALILFCNLLFAAYPENSVVAQNGKLKVIGTQLCNEEGDPIQLRGVSSHGLQWFGEFMHEQSIQMFAEEWKATVIRASMYTAPEADGYIENKELKNKVIEIVNLAEKYGIYCIIDWHMLSDNDPNTYKNESKEFFQEMVTLFKDKKHVLYEICNEPDDQVTWEEHIKPYAEELIPVIQDVDNDAIVLVGTTFWCQDVDVAADDPIEGKNIMYTLHFYAGEHGKWVKNKFNYAVTKIPLFVSEFGTTMADGDRGFYPNATNQWLQLLHKHNISWVNWSLSNKNEDCAILKSNTPYDKAWTNEDLTQSGLFIKDRLIEGYKEGPYTLTVPSIPNVEVKISPEKESYDLNEEIEITALPVDGYKFHRWNGLVTGLNPATVTVAGDFTFWPEVLPENEHIVNGNFSEGDYQWKFIAWGGAEAEGRVESQTFEALIDKAGNDPWEIQLEQKDLEITKDAIYRLQFTASAEEEREISVNVGMSQEPWDTYSNFGNFTISTEPTTFTRTFQMKNSSDNNGRLFFDLGKYSDANVKISKVSLIDTTEIIPVLHTATATETSTHVKLENKKLHLTIPDLQTTGAAEVTLLSINGRELLRKEFRSAKQQTIDLHTAKLSTGIYIVKISNMKRVSYHPVKL